MKVAGKRKNSYLNKKKEKAVEITSATGSRAERTFRHFLKKTVQLQVEDRQLSQL